LHLVGILFPHINDNARSKLHQISQRGVIESRSFIPSALYKADRYVSDLRHAPTIFKRYSTVCFVDRLFTLRANLITFHVVLYVSLCASHLLGYDPTENTPSPLHNMFARPHSEQSQRLSHQDRTEMGAMENLNSLVCSVVTPTGHSVNSCSKQFAVLFHCPAVLVTCLAIDRHGTAFGLATEPGSWWQLIRAKY